MNRIEKVLKKLKLSWNFTQDIYSFNYKINYNII